MVPLKLPFDAYFDHDNFLYVDQCAAEIILQDVRKICTHASGYQLCSYWKEAHSVELCSCLVHAQHKNEILVPACLPRLFPIVPI
mgnify:CR=1 FL=1